MHIDGASSRFGANWLLELVTVCGGDNGSGSDDRRLGYPSFQACDLFLQRCDLVAEFVLTALKYP